MCGYARDATNAFHFTITIFQGRFWAYVSMLDIFGMKLPIEGFRYRLSHLCRNGWSVTGVEALRKMWFGSRPRLRTPILISPNGNDSKCDNVFVKKLINISERGQI